MTPMPVPVGNLQRIVRAQRTAQSLEDAQVVEGMDFASHELGQVLPCRALRPLASEEAGVGDCAPPGAR